MPELPEVETIVRELRSKIVGKSIKDIDELRPETVISENNLNVCQLGKIIAITRRGKYIIVSTDRKFVLLVHLRMTGKLIYLPDDAPVTKHTRAIMYFTDRTKIIFDDIRTFGSIKIFQSIDKTKILEDLGCEPLSKLFNTEYLADLLAAKRTTIKNFLLDQRYIAGLGNIYVNEILYLCKLPPHKLTNTLSDDEVKCLVKNTRKILKKAIEHNGTSISDYRRVDNKTGQFQNLLKVYGKDTCFEGHAVKRIKTNGRSTFYCPECQKE